MAKIDVNHFNFAIREGQSPELSDIIIKSPYHSKYVKRLHSTDFLILRIEEAMLLKYNLQKIRSPGEFLWIKYLTKVSEINRPNFPYPAIDRVSAYYDL